MTRPVVERKVAFMIGVYIRPASMSPEQYKSIDDQVRATGVEPKGMKLHTCFGEGPGIAIFDVWETQEDFDAFAAVLGSDRCGVGTRGPAADDRADDRLRGSVTASSTAQLSR